MELAHALRRLWSHKLLLVSGLTIAMFAGLSSAYKVGLFPPKLESKDLTFSSAATQLLVDGPRSAIADLSLDTQPLVERAQILSQYAARPAVQSEIAAAAGLPVGSFALAGQVSSVQDRGISSGEPTAQERADSLAQRGTGALVTLTAQDLQPVVQVAARAASPDLAARLANGAADGIISYTKRLQAQQNVPEGSRIQIRKLGVAAGGSRTTSSNKTTALAVGGATFIGWCVLLLIVGALAREWRAAGVSPPNGLRTTEPSEA